MTLRAWIMMGGFARGGPTIRLEGHRCSPRRAGRETLSRPLSRCAQAGQRMRAVIPSFAVIEIGIMAGKSSGTADEEQRRALLALSRSRDRGEADRARAILLTLSGWTSGQIAEAFGVREDT